jgi:CDP-glucose 4,6-dehydratase
MGIWSGALENLAMTPSFWQGKSVFITGHTGFKGSWLSLWLQQLGAKVIGFSLPPPSEPNLFTLGNIAKNMTHIQGDIQDSVLLQKSLMQHQPDIIFHMAAQSLVQHSYDFPVETYAVNVMGTVNLLEAVRQCKNIKAVINITSDKCYENKEWEWGYRENEPLGGYDPYSSSKACAELVTSAYRQSFFGESSTAIASARAGNVIGGGDWAKNRLIPDMIRSFVQQKTVLIRNPDAIRPWQHVLEPLAGYLLLAEKLWDKPKNFAQAWNFGPYVQDIQPVKYIADKLSQLWGNSAGWEQEANHLPHEAHILKLDIAKAKKYLGWTPHLNLEEALHYVTLWYKAWQNQQDMQKFTLSQIEQFQSGRNE